MNGFRRAILMRKPIYRSKYLRNSNKALVKSSFNLFSFVPGGNTWSQKWRLLLQLGFGPIFMNRLRVTFLGLAFAVGCAEAQPVQTQAALKSRFKVLALAEAGGHHVAFTAAAKPWLNKCGEQFGFELDYLTNTAPITSTFLARYGLILQLDFVPYGWTPEAMAAFKTYIQEGRGGWVGLHHASLLGNFDGYPMWPWFSEFMGSIKFRSYIPKFASATVHVEDRTHPCMKDVPEFFVIPREEWYTYDGNPRTNVHVLASVDESTYAPATDVRMGDHPVIWSNDHVKARNVYIFMGHGPDLFESNAFVTILRNSILWAARR
jgi:hypothetical protein